MCCLPRSYSFGGGFLFQHPASLVNLESSLQSPLRVAGFAITCRLFLTGSLELASFRRNSSHHCTLNPNKLQSVRVPTQSGRTVPGPVHPSTPLGVTLFFCVRAYTTPVSSSGVPALPTQSSRRRAGRTVPSRPMTPLDYPPNDSAGADVRHPGKRDRRSR